MQSIKQNEQKLFVSEKDDPAGSCELETHPKLQK